MIQNGTYLNIVDNSGAKVACCIKVMIGYKRRYARIGDLVMISIKSLRTKRRFSSKTKKGEVYRALLIRAKVNKVSYNGDFNSFFENSAVLLTKQNKLLGTRIFGSISKSFRYTKYLKLLSLSAGTSS